VAQNAITVPVILVLKGTYIQAVTPVVCCELFWEEPCPDFWEVKSVFHNIFGRIFIWSTASTVNFRVLRDRPGTCSMFYSVLDMDCGRDQSP
jgi:hypothetical protein